MGKTVKFQVKVQLSSEVSGSRRSAAAAALAACIYRIRTWSLWPECMYV